MSQRVVTSTTNTEVKRLKPLFSSARARREAGLFVAEGRSLCAEAAQAGLAREYWYTEQNAEFATQLAKKNGALITLMSDVVSEKLSEQKTPQGVFAVCEFPKESECAAGKSAIGLFDISDPVNAGAMLRTALALGYGGAVMAGESADIFSPKSLRGAMGAQLKLPVIRFAEKPQAIAHFKSLGYKCIAAALTEGAQPLSHLKPDASPKLLIFGNEAAGLDQATLAECTSAIIPMSAGFDSLNAAVAAGIFMWHFRAEGI